MLRCYSILFLALVSALAVGCGDDSQTAPDSGRPDTGPPRDAAVDGGPVDVDGGPTDVDGGPMDVDGGEDARLASAGRNAAGEELVDMRLAVALADSLFDFDPTLDPAVAPEANAARISTRVMAVAPGCAMVSVSAAVVTAVFGAPPGCTLTTGLVVSGTVTATVTQSGPTTTVTVAAGAGLTINGRALTFTLVFATSDGSTFHVSGPMLDLTIHGGMGMFTANGSITSSRSTPATSVMLMGLVWARGACYPSAGTLTITIGGITQTLTASATTPMTGIAQLRIAGGATMPFMLPAYAGCPPPATMRCGNGVVDPGEACDGPVSPPGATCESLGLGSGTPSCTDACTISGCMAATDGARCTNSLAYASTADFDISFDVNVTSLGAHMALAGQRESCGATTMTYWAARLGTDGTVGWEDAGFSALGDGTWVPESLDSTTRITAGTTHHVGLRRVAGVLSTYVDGVTGTATLVSGTDHTTDLVPLQNGTHPCIGVDGTEPLSGMVTNVCIRHQVPVCPSVQSTFDASTQGWSTNNAATFERRIVGADSLLFVAPAEAPEVCRIHAPPYYHGDLRPFIGGALSFDAQMVDSGGTMWNMPPDDFGFVRFTARDGSYMDYDAELGTSGEPMGVFTHYSVPLTAGPRWSASDVEVTPAMFDAILADVTDLRITVEALYGPESHYIDNIVLECARL